MWWKYSDDDVFPWSPLVKDIDRANIHIYCVTRYVTLFKSVYLIYIILIIRKFVCSSKLDLLCYHRTEYDLLGVAFSSVESNIMYVVEQKISREVSDDLM